jgi:hypothetical protein
LDRAGPKYRIYRRRGLWCGRGTKRKARDAWRLRLGSGGNRQTRRQLYMPADYTLILGDTTLYVRPRDSRAPSKKSCIRFLAL